MVEDFRCVVLFRQKIISLDFHLVCSSKGEVSAEPTLPDEEDTEEDTEEEAVDSSAAPPLWLSALGYAAMPQNGNAKGENTSEA